MMTRYNWNRRQIATQYRVWKSFREEESNVVTISDEAVLSSLEDLCNGVSGQTESTHGIQMMLDRFERTYDKDDMKRIRNSEANLFLWFSEILNGMYGRRDCVVVFVLLTTLGFQIGLIVAVHTV
jgi:hypothetical protein